ncbi:MAG: hypothetical protein Q8P59_03130, partial [Dehalococcoidia bacterium]|nr:hypothetical protein [Dehalococcoidia bacterium]
IGRVGVTSSPGNQDVAASPAGQGAVVSQTGISVQGAGTASAAPDQAEIALGHPIMFSETLSVAPPVPFGLGGAAVAPGAVAPPVPSGELEIQMIVQVTYAIE